MRKLRVCCEVAVDMLREYWTVLMAVLALMVFCVALVASALYCFGRLVEAPVKHISKGTTTWCEKNKDTRFCDVWTAK